MVVLKNENIVPVLTPFDDDGNVDVESVGSLVAHMKARGVTRSVI